MIICALIRAERIIQVSKGLHGCSCPSYVVKCISHAFPKSELFSFTILVLQSHTAQDSDCRAKYVRMYRSQLGMFVFFCIR